MSCCQKKLSIIYRMSLCFPAATGSLLLLFVITIGANPCLLPKDVGPCRAAISRYYYDGLSGQCQQFFFGGCGGNDNNFETMTDCTSKCEVDISRPGYIFKWKCKDMHCKWNNCRLVEDETQRIYFNKCLPHSHLQSTWSQCFDGHHAWVGIYSDEDCKEGPHQVWSSNNC